MSLLLGLFGPAVAERLGKGLAWLAWVAAALGLLVGAYAAGRFEGMARQAELHAQQDKAALQEQHAAYVLAVDRGASAAAALLADLDTTRTQRDALIRKASHAPYTVRTQTCPDPAAVHLSAGGLVRWNAALGFTDAAPGACGADGAAEGACEADSGVGLDEARANAEENGSRLSECVARLKALQRFEQDLKGN